MKYRRILAILLVLTAIISFSGCKEAAKEDISSQTEITSEKKSRDYITLLYSLSDTFNPYTVKTDINRQLCKLLYEPLVKLDNNFSPVNSIAQSIVLQGKKCTVTIKNVTFSDGSSVTANDIIHSYNLAKNSQSYYAAKLYEVSSVQASGTSAVVFNLTKADPYFANVLDFPIIKAGSESVTDSDSVLQPPIGCGRYKVAEDKQSLVLNELFWGTKSSIKHIRLINAPDTESVTHYAQVGAADMYYSDISDGNILRMSGKKQNINLNNIVYIGINKNYGELEQNALRQALSSGIDRTKICQDAFYNNALPSIGFFSPVWEEVKSVQNIQITSNSKITVENLEKIGYNRLDSKGKRINNAGSGLNFTLLVNSQNRSKAVAAKLIAEQLGQYGIGITVLEKNYAEYSAFLSEGNFQLFLGEVKLTENMDISPMVLEGATASFGYKKATEEKNTENTASAEDISQADKVSEIINGFYESRNTIADVASVLQTEMPFIPICYRTGVLFYNDKIENVINSSASDIYFSIESYIYN